MLFNEDEQEQYDDYREKVKFTDLIPEDQEKFLNSLSDSELERFIQISAGKGGEDTNARIKQAKKDILGGK